MAFQRTGVLTSTHIPCSFLFCYPRVFARDRQTEEARARAAKAEDALEVLQRESVVSWCAVMDSVVALIGRRRFA